MFKASKEVLPKDSEQIPDSTCGNMLKMILPANRGLQSLQKKNTGNNIKFRGKNQV